MEYAELPLGFAMSLAARRRALEAFGRLSGEEQEAWVARSRHVTSQEEMNQLVTQLLTQRRP
jgi:hypothetical protein